MLDVMVEEEAAALDRIPLAEALQRVLAYRQRKGDSTAITTLLVCTLLRADADRIKESKAQVLEVLSRLGAEQNLLWKELQKLRAVPNLPELQHRTITKSLEAALRRAQGKDVEKRKGLLRNWKKKTLVETDFNKVDLGPLPVSTGPIRVGPVRNGRIRFRVRG